MVQLLWKKFKIEFTYDPSIPRLGIYPQVLKTGSQQSIYTSMFRATLFMRAKMRKQHKRLATDKWLSKMWYIHIQSNIIQPFKRRKF